MSIIDILMSFCKSLYIHACLIALVCSHGIPDQVLDQPFRTNSTLTQLSYPELWHKPLKDKNLSVDKKIQNLKKWLFLFFVIMSVSLFLLFSKSESCFTLRALSTKSRKRADKVGEWRSYSRPRSNLWVILKVTIFSNTEKNENCVHYKFYQL